MILVARVEFGEWLTTVLWALVFAWLAAVEVLGEGINLPSHLGPAETAVANRTAIRAASASATWHPLAETPERVWAMYAYHLVLVCTLLCAAFIEYDGAVVPWRL